MQTILGAGGAIGTELAKALRQYTDRVRLVSRSPRRVSPGDQLHAADLTKPLDTLKAVAGSKIAYLTVGLPYRTRIWRETWPVIMKNVIDACKIHRTKLVFFDNVYMYDPEYLDVMTEQTPVRPVSGKGAVRAQIAEMLQDECGKGDLQALIARSADFYGPAIAGSSILTETVFNRIRDGRKALWQGSVGFRHAFTYTPDAAAATALLGNSADSYNQVWHLPTAADPPTGKEWIETIAEEMDSEPGFRVLTRFQARAAGLFVPLMRELAEMMYQFDRDYVFDSSKFTDRFAVRPTPYHEGIRQIVMTDCAEFRRRESR